MEDNDLRSWASPVSLAESSSPSFVGIYQDELPLLPMVHGDTITTTTSTKRPLNNSLEMPEKVREEAASVWPHPPSRARGKILASFKKQEVSNRMIKDRFFKWGNLVRLLTLAGFFQDYFWSMRTTLIIKDLVEQGELNHQQQQMGPPRPEGGVDRRKESFAIFSSLLFWSLSLTAGIALELNNRFQDVPCSLLQCTVQIFRQKRSSDGSSERSNSTTTNGSRKKGKKGRKLVIFFGLYLCLLASAIPVFLLLNSGNLSSFCAAYKVLMIFVMSVRLADIRQHCRNQSCQL